MQRQKNTSVVIIEELHEERTAQKNRHREIDVPWWSDKLAKIPSKVKRRRKLGPI